MTFLKASRAVVNDHPLQQQRRRTRAPSATDQKTALQLLRNADFVDYGW